MTVAKIIKNTFIPTKTFQFLNMKINHFSYFYFLTNKRLSPEQTI